MTWNLGLKADDDFGTFFGKRSNKFAKLLKKSGTTEKVCRDVMNSGYYLWHKELDIPYGGKDLIVHDGFYGQKWLYGFIPFNLFSDYINGRNSNTLKELRSNLAPEYTVSNVGEMLQILQSPRHKKYYEDGRITFRGQVKEHFYQRAIPHPIKGSKERLILPGYWRQFHSNFAKRKVRDVPTSILKSDGFYRAFMKEIKGLDDCELRRKNEFIYLDFWPDYMGVVLLSKIGSLQSGDMATRGLSWGNARAFELACPDWVSVPDFLRKIGDENFRNYISLWFKYQVAINFSDTPVLLEQHYGINTCALDLTFDLLIAVFFATQKFTRKEKEGRILGDYSPIVGGPAGAVVYCFVFEEPPVEKTDNLVKEFGMFDQFKPIRPLRQSCGLVYMASEQINEAAVELDAVFHLTGRFDSGKLPSKEDLFPSRIDDKFYDLLLSLKEDGEPLLQDIVEYSF